jgi:hypothetical protein
MQIGFRALDRPLAALADTGVLAGIALPPAQMPVVRQPSASSAPVAAAAADRRRGAGHFARWL